MKKKILAIALALALLAVLVAPLAAFASDGTTTITGDVTSGYSFTPPAAISLGSMSPSAPAANNSSGTLNGNNASGYTVTAVDASTTNTGYMVSGTNVLQNYFMIGKDTSSLAAADTAQTLLNSTAAGSNPVPLYVSQTISPSDAIATGYSITITFTVTANP